MRKAIIIGVAALALCRVANAQEQAPAETDPHPAAETCRQEMHKLVEGKKKINIEFQAIAGKSKTINDPKLCAVSMKLANNLTQRVGLLTRCAEALKIKKEVADEEIKVLRSQIPELREGCP